MTRRCAVFFMPFTMTLRYCRDLPPFQLCIFSPRTVVAEAIFVALILASCSGVNLRQENEQKRIVPHLVFDAEYGCVKSFLHVSHILCPRILIYLFYSRMCRVVWRAIPVHLISCDSEANRPYYCIRSCWCCLCYISCCF